MIRLYQMSGSGGDQEIYLVDCVEGVQIRMTDGARDNRGLAEADARLYASGQWDASDVSPESDVGPIDPYLRGTWNKPIPTYRSGQEWLWHEVARLTVDDKWIVYDDSHSYISNSEVER